MKLITDSLGTYIETFRIHALFGVMALAVILLLFSFFTYVVGGAAFLRYSDVVAGAVTPQDGAAFVVLGLVGLFTTAFLSVAVTTVVKFRRSLDDVGFFKLCHHFPEYTIRLTTAWAVIVLATFVIGIAGSFLRLHNAISAALMLLLWAFFIFLPQSIVIKDLSFSQAMRDSAKLCRKKPLAIVLFYLSTLVLLFLLIVLEVLIGQTKIFWLPPIISAIVLFLFIIPYLEIVKANIYLTRYKLLLSGLV